MQSAYYHQLSNKIFSMMTRFCKNRSKCAHGYILKILMCTRLYTQNSKCAHGYILKIPVQEPN